MYAFCVAAVCRFRKTGLELILMVRLRDAVSEGKKEDYNFFALSPICKAGQVQHGGVAASLDDIAGSTT